MWVCYMYTIVMQYGRLYTPGIDMIATSDWLLVYTIYM